ncbi:Peptidyl-prolyl cis-trans isomerase PpiD [hydrothermal vent metagenome]|uniref:Peptidyl-prolyl cis-trans isomerase PpiD n=1 Tax=hydrothermal vent metagenome TaxID=652676 RepID=A0A3B0TQZ3_9ZZZZ
MVNLINTSSSPLPSGKVKVPHPPKPDSTPPILVNGVKIEFEAIGAETQLHPAKTPGEAYREAVRALVVRELLVQEAAAKNIVAKPEQYDSGHSEMAADAAIRQLLELEIKTPEADEAACKTYYEANRNKFCSETIYEAKHILFAAPISDQKARREAMLAAKQVIKQLDENPSRFGELALAHSACPSKEQGGSLGQLTKGSTVAEFEEVLFELDPGQMSSAPVASQFGYHVILLERIIKGEQLPFEAVKTRIGAWLEASSWSRAVSQYISLLAGRAEIEGFDMGGSDTPLVQ